MLCIKVIVSTYADLAGNPEEIAESAQLNILSLVSRASTRPPIVKQHRESAKSRPSTQSNNVKQKAGVRNATMTRQCPLTFSTKKPPTS